MARNILNLYSSVKNFLGYISLIVVITSCASSKHSAGTGSSASKPVAPVHEPRFLENISIHSSRTAQPVVNAPELKEEPRLAAARVFAREIEKCNPLQFKYAILMDEPVESMTDERLIGFLEEWYGAPYEYGGGSRSGIDCSAFTCVLMDSVYHINLPRTAREQYSANTKVKRKDLERGDLIFFNTSGGISHVGVYLANNKFVHASTSSGVMISDMDDVYFKRRYVGAARVR